MPKNNDKQQNIEYALQYVYDLFLENGIENTTKEMLVRTSGISRSSIDRYFSSKLDCVLQTARWVCNNIMNHNSRIMEYRNDKEHTGIELLRIYLEIVRDLAFEKPQMFALCMECRLFVFRNTKTYEEGCALLNELLGSSVLVGKVIERGIADGTIRAVENPKQEASYVREAYLGLLTSIAIARSPELQNDKDFIDKYINVVLQRFNTE